MGIQWLFNLALSIKQRIGTLASIVFQIVGWLSVWDDKVTARTSQLNKDRPMSHLNSSFLQLSVLWILIRTGKGFYSSSGSLFSLLSLTVFITSLHWCFKIPNSSHFPSTSCPAHTCATTMIHRKSFLFSYSPVTHSKVWSCPFLGQCSTLTVVFAD